MSFCTVDFLPLSELSSGIVPNPAPTVFAGHPDNFIDAILPCGC